MTTLLTALLLANAPTLAGNSDWPHIRGPKLDGRAQSEGLFDAQNVGFVPSWKAPLGSSYAGVVVSDGRVVTAYSDGERDVLVALGERDGSELWRHDLGPTYRGHDGSDDGVISTPVIDGDTVYAMTPYGTLLSVAASDGQVRWSIDLRETFGAPLPEHGFGSTPILEGGLLIVQVGGPKSLCAFDPGTGELAWSVGDKEVWYQSPLAMDLAGKRQLVVLAQDEIHGLEPTDGSILWRHPIGRGTAQTGIATPVDANRFVASVSSQLSMIEVQAVESGEGFTTREVFRSRELGGSYATPVYHEGYLYGFKSDFLTCINAETGRRVWKSRPPGGRGLIGVEDRLLVFGAQGIAVIARATPDGYEEEDRIQALESTGYSWPSFASNAIYVRNLDSMARVEIKSRTGAVDASAMIDDSTDHEAAYARFEKMIDAAGLSMGEAGKFLEQQSEMPIVRDGYVHLLFQGEAEDVGVSFSGRDESRVFPMQKLGDSNCYYRGFSIEDSRRYEYQFQVDFGNWRADAKNPRQAPPLRGPNNVSSLITAGFEEHRPHVRGDQPAAGKVDEFQFESEMLGNTRTIRVYTPPGYDADGDKLYPLLLVHQGGEWIQKGQLTGTLDNLIGESVEPVVVAFIDPLRRWWLESGGTGTDAYLDMLCEELLGELHFRYQLSDAPSDRALMGTRGFGLTAAYGALRHPEVFGKAAAQSIDLGDVTQYAFFEKIEKKAGSEALIYMDWNLYEKRNIDRGYDKRDDSLRAFNALKDKGYRVVGGEAADTHGWGSWRSRADQILETLFPME